MEFIYQPIVGPLSGASFEEQTVAFFKGIEDDYLKRILDLKTYFDSKMVDVGTIMQDISEIQAQISDINSTITNVQSDITGLRNAVNANTANIAINKQDIVTVNGRVDNAEARITKLEESMESASGDITAIQDRLDGMQLEINTAMAGVVKAGTIVLFNATPPDGYIACNGSGETPDLSAYTTPPLTYARKS